jgi:hypothetical protein
LPKSSNPLTNPLSLAAGQVGKVALAAVDHVAVKRFGDAQALYERVLSANPRATPDALATAIIRRVAGELGAAGALSGAVAAAPGVGTSASIATGAADVGMSFGRLTAMVLAVGLAYQHDLSDPEHRKQHAYAVLAGSGDQLTAGERKAGNLKKQLGNAALDRNSENPVTGMLTSKVGVKVVSKIAAQSGAVRLGTMLPLGIGAGIGVVGNRALAFSVGRAATRYFADPNVARSSAVLKPALADRTKAVKNSVKESVMDRVKRSR